MTNKQKVEIAHHRAVKAAQQYEAATPGTRSKEKRYANWLAAERKFNDALKNLWIYIPVAEREASEW